MDPRWYTEAVIYSLDVETFADSNGDGIGDIRGLIGRLDYLSRLGVTCLWLNPIHPTPGRDDGYDVTDFYGVDRRLGSLGDFAELVYRAENRGIKVMIDLVVNHTSDEHPWFVEAQDPKSEKHGWYIWSKDEPPDRFQGMVFPGEQKETWTWSEPAQAWYYHRFYEYQPDLNVANPAVRAEILRIVGFWLQLGVAGFRIDAVPFIIELTEPGNANSPKDFNFLSDLRAHAQWRRGDSVLLAEANVEPDQLATYFTDDHTSNRLHMLFDFMLNGRVALGLARKDPEPIIDALRDTPQLPDGGQWATFLRNHDEIDLSRLTTEQRSDVIAEFGPDENMLLYDRGIRRRLAPMLRGDRRRLELAYSLQFTLRGTPVLRYGDEIGMGENLELSGRYAIRTPMQWSGGRNAGFSTAPVKRLVRPPVSGGEFGFETVNVDAQRHEKDSLLNWFERMLHTLRESPEVGCGTCTHVDVPVPRGVLVHRADGESGTMVFLHNLCDEPGAVDLSSLAGEASDPDQVFADGDYPHLQSTDELANVELAGYGYRWIRLRRSL